MDEIRLDDESQANHTSSPTVYKRLNWTFVVGYLLLQAGDNLPGSYRYALYDSYGINRSTIELLNVVSYMSSLFIGTLTSALADRYGRRLICFLSAGSFIVHNALLNFSVLWILVIANIFRGLANAFLFVGPEAWLIQEYRNNSLELQSLQRIFRNAFVTTSFISIFGSVLAQLLVELGGITAPFYAAIVVFVLMIVFTWHFWSENYGSKETKVMRTFVTAIQILRADPRIVLLGLAAALCDASWFIYIIEWTPMLQRAQGSNNDELLPLGIIFSILMVFEMIGSFIFNLLAKRIRVQSFMIVVFLLTAIGLLIPVIVPDSFPLIIIGFILFEINFGIYRPSMSVLRSAYIPDEVRATMMSCLRIPQMIVMIVILVCHFSLNMVFVVCASCNVLSMLCMIALRGLKFPKLAEENLGETETLLQKPLSLSFKSKQLPPRIVTEVKVDH